MELTTMYESLGVSRAVYEYGEKILAELKPRFEALDQTAEYNQTKVLAAMQKNKLSAGCFAATTGYGYDDMGREVLEKVYADCFGTEAALVRPQITCGTHALAVALGANLLPGDELLSPNGAPYDTLEEVIGIRPSKCSLMEYGVSYRQVDLLPDYGFDYPAIEQALRGGGVHGLKADDLLGSRRCAAVDERALIVGAVHAVVLGDHGVIQLAEAVGKVGVREHVVHERARLHRLFRAAAAGEHGEKAAEREQERNGLFHKFTSFLIR